MGSFQDCRLMLEMHFSPHECLFGLLLQKITNGSILGIHWNVSLVLCGVV